MQAKSNLSFLAVWKARSLIAPAVLVFAVASCEASPDIVVGGLPSFVALGDCPPVDAPDPCVWAQSADAVVLGTLKATRLVKEPAMVLRLEGDPARQVAEIVDTCSGWIDPAMRLDVDVTEVFLGSPPRSLTAHIGADQISHYSPMPTLAAAGEVEWLGAASPTAEFLEPGQTIGLALHYVPDLGIWSVMGEALFDFPPVDSIRLAAFQEFKTDCHEPPPQDLAALTVSEFAGRLAQCGLETSDAAAERRVRVQNVWGKIPSEYTAAICGEAIEESIGCAVSADCGFGLECVGGACQ